MLKKPIIFPAGVIIVIALLAVGIAAISLPVGTQVRVDFRINDLSPYMEVLTGTYSKVPLSSALASRRDVPSITSVAAGGGAYQLNLTVTYGGEFVGLSSFAGLVAGAYSSSATFLRAEPILSQFS